MRDVFMKRSLALARRGYGRTGPNPMVGALVVREGRIVGKGHHLFERRLHAEIVALQEAGPAADGGDLYVNLEPCSHQGRTPPCVDQIIQAGVKRVFVAVEDPFPRVSGRGIAALRQAGIAVETGLCRSDAVLLNQAFLFSVRTRRPWIIIKAAMSWDGRIAAADGRSQWISGPEARAAVHRLRFGSDAILVGSGTIRQDDPSLAVQGPRRNTICKVVLDSRLRTPIDARIFQSGDPVLLFHADDGPAVPPAYPAHCRTIAVSGSDDGLDWQAVLEHLDCLSIRSLIIEGGQKVITSALRAGLGERFQFYYGPLILGAEGLDGVGGLGGLSLQSALQLVRVKSRRFGSSVMLEGYRKGSLSDLENE